MLGSSQWRKLPTPVEEGSETQKKVCVPKSDHHFQAPLIDFFFFHEENLSYVGGMREEPRLPSPPPRNGKPWPDWALTLSLRCQTHVEAGRSQWQRWLEGGTARQCVMPATALLCGTIVALDSPDP